MTEWLHFYFSLSCIGERNGNPLQYSCLENPRDGGACQEAIYGVAQSWTQLKRLSSSSSRLSMRQRRLHQGGGTNFEGLGKAQVDLPLKVGSLEAEWILQHIQLHLVSEFLANKQREAMYLLFDLPIFTKRDRLNTTLPCPPPPPTPAPPQRVIWELLKTFWFGNFGGWKKNPFQPFWDSRQSQLHMALSLLQQQ